MGKLKSGQRPVAGVVPASVYDVLRGVQESREWTMSRTVGEALREWAENRPSALAPPRPGAGEGSEPSGSGKGSAPADVPAIELRPWQEASGTVRELADLGGSLRLVLDTPGGPVAATVPASLRGALAVGIRVAILRTDHPVLEYVVRKA